MPSCQSACYSAPQMPLRVSSCVLVSKIPKDTISGLETGGYELPKGGFHAIFVDMNISLDLDENLKVNYDKFDQLRQKYRGAVDNE